MNTRDYVFAATCAIVALMVFSPSALAVDPTINVTWVGSPGPFAGTDYEIDGTDPAYQNVELITGGHTWNVWSVDTDNPDDIGDIGDITCPNPGDFRVRILDDSDGPGARDGDKGGDKVRLTY